MVAPFFDAPRYPGPSYNLSKSIQKNPVPQQSHKNKNRKKTTTKKNGTLSVMMVISSTPARPAIRYMVRASLVQVNSEDGA